MSAPALVLEGGQEALLRERQLRRRFFAPAPRMTVDEWADRFRRLSRISSASEGRWRTDRVPFLREIMQCWTDPAYDRIVFKKPAQVGGTEIIANCLGHTMHLDPWGTLVVQPTVDLAKIWSKERLDPMIRDTPVLRPLVQEGHRREKGQEIQRKGFPGGFVAIIGANSAAGLRMRPVPKLLNDEVDAWPASARGASKGHVVGAAGEGDPLTLLRRRQTAFWNRKELAVSTPTLKGFSRIDREYEASDQRTYWVPCPHCGHEQRLWWRNLIWEPGKPETAAYRCGEVDEKTGELKEGCGQLIPEHSKMQMLRRGRWIPAKPGRRTAGFWINGLYSPFMTWAEVVGVWLSAQGNAEELRAFINTILAETWSEEGEEVEQSELEARRELYPSEVPAGVRVLTLGVDVQADRLETTVWGWGFDEEPWQIRHEVLWGSPEKSEVWSQLDLVRRRPWKQDEEHTLRIRATAIDSGGHHTEEVYRYCKARARSAVFCVKGSSEPGHAAIAPPAKKSKAKVRLWMLGTEAIKDTLYARLRKPADGPGPVHFSRETTSDYLRQLVSEVGRTRHHRGRPVRIYERKLGERGEALDCWVYAYAALLILGPVREALRRWKPAKKEEPKEELPAPETASSESPPVDAEPPELPAPKPRQPRRGGSWRRW